MKFKRTLEDLRTAKHLILSVDILSARDNNRIFKASNELSKVIEHLEAVEHLERLKALQH